MNKDVKGSTEPSLTGLPPTKISKGINNNCKTSNSPRNIPHSNQNSSPKKRN